MNDQLLLNNYLLVLKSTVEVYVHGTLESSNEQIRCLLKECLDNTISMQSSTYDEMVQYDWYIVDNLEAKDIEKVFSKLQKQS